MHDLRHSAASMLIATGADLAAISRQLGQPIPRSRWRHTRIGLRGGPSVTSVPSWPRWSVAKWLRPAQEPVSTARDCLISWRPGRNRTIDTRISSPRPQRLSPLPAPPLPQTEPSPSASRMHQNGACSVCRFSIPAPPALASPPTRPRRSRQSERADARVAATSFGCVRAQCPRQAPQALSAYESKVDEIHRIRPPVATNVQRLRHRDSACGWPCRPRRQPETSRAPCSA